MGVLPEELIKNQKKLVSDCVLDVIEFNRRESDYMEMYDNPGSSIRLLFKANTPSEIDPRPENIKGALKDDFKERLVFDANSVLHLYAWGMEKEFVGKTRSIEKTAKFIAEKYEMFSDKSVVKDLASDFSRISPDRASDNENFKQIRANVLKILGSKSSLPPPPPTPKKTGEWPSEKHERNFKTKFGAMQLVLKKIDNMLVTSKQYNNDEKEFLRNIKREFGIYIKNAHTKDILASEFYTNRMDDLKQFKANSARSINFKSNYEKNFGR